MNHPLPSPNLVILGAQKSGTTSLAEYLKAHPDIFMSNPLKEPGYYLGEERARIFWRRMGAPIESREELLRDRMLQDYQGQKWFGDASTYYSIGKRSRLFKVPDWMYQSNPDMRLVYIMRDPVARILSNFRHCRARGKAGDNIAEFLESPEGRMGLLTSRYHYQLSAYLEKFDKTQFCLLLFEDLLANPAEVLSKVWSFLELDDIPAKSHYAPYNVSTGKDDHCESATLKELQCLQPLLMQDMEKLSSEWGLDLHTWPSFAGV